MSEIKAIRNHVIFQFEDEIVRKSDHGTTRTQFSEKTDWGFEISDYDEGAKNPRWGIVTAIGNEVDLVEIGDKILIEALQWTESFKFEGSNFWRTNVDKIMAIDDDYNK